MKFKPGDPVKLTERYANVLLRSRKCKVDWHTRRAVVKMTGKRYVYVLWSGNRRTDYYDHSVIEIA